MKNIIIWGISNYNWLWLPLAERLKREHNVNIHFICINVRDIEYWKRMDKHGVIDSFTAINHFFPEYDNCTDPPETIYRMARGYEERYDFLVSDALQADRHLGRGFSSAGIGHPKSELSRKATYIKSVNIFNRCMKFWEKLIGKIDPDLIIGSTSGVVGKTLSVIARCRGIDTRILSSAKYQSYFYWAVDEFYTFPEVEENFKLIKDIFNHIDYEELKGVKRLPWTAINYQIYMRYSSIWSLITRVISQSVNKIFKRYKRIVSMGNYGLSEEIRYIYRMHREIRNMHGLNLTDVNSLKGKSYIFYPLHVEPEAALGTISPEFNEQLALIELIAKNLPAGTLLVVKEHLAALGRRPRDFYSTILEIPNVVMISPDAYASEVAKGARCVAVITSTLGTEAAILGIPVISFGVHNSFGFLPHVHTVESWKELRPLLVDLCKDRDRKKEEIRKEDGMRYAAALKVSSIDLSKSNYNSKKREPATEEELKILYTSLIKSLEKRDCKPEYVYEN